MQSMSRPIQGKKIEKILKGKIDETQKSNDTWIVTKIKRLFIKSDKKLGPPLLYLKCTQEASNQNRQTLSAFNGNLGVEIKSQKGIPLDHGSEFWDITGIKTLFLHHEDKIEYLT